MSLRIFTNNLTISGFMSGVIPVPKLKICPEPFPKLLKTFATSSVMIFSSETDHREYKLVLLGVISLVMGLTYIIFRMADNLTQR